MERVIAAPLTPQGLGGAYTQVEAIPRVPHPRQNAEVVRYRGEVWLIGGQDEGKSRHKTNDKLVGISLIENETKHTPPPKKNVTVSHALFLT